MMTREFENKVQDLNLVMERFIKLCVENCDEAMLEEMMTAVDDRLDDLQSSDAFGSDGKSDPRGDFRNGEFSLWDIEE